MATIPRLNRPSVRATPEQSTLPNINPAQAVGVGLQQAAQVTGEFARELNRLNEIRVNEALAEYATEADRFLNDPKDGLMARQGTKAAEGLDPFRDRVNLARADIEAKLGNENQRALFARQAERFTNEANRRAFWHIQNETRKVDAQSFEVLTRRDLGSVIAAAQQGADPSAIITEMQRRVATYGDRQGWAPEVIAQARTEMISTARLAQVEALAARDPEMASKVLTDHLEEIAPSQREKARTFVDAANMAVRSQSNRDVILAEFGDDEKAALEAVHARFEGAMEDQVSQRVQAAYADRRRLLTEDTNRLFNAGAARVMQTGDIGSVDPATIATLTERNPALVTRLERLARQKRTGEAAETDYNVWIPLTNMNADALRSVDPMQYRDVLADREFNILTDMVARAKGTGKFASEEPGLTPAQFESNLFQLAKGDGLLPANATSQTQLKGENLTRYTQLKQAVDAEIQGWRQANGDRSPPRSVQLELIQKALDDRVMEVNGLFGGVNPQSIPRAMALPTDKTRELEGEERVSLDQRIGVREAQRVRAEARGELRARGFNVSDNTLDAILLIQSDPRMTDDQKRTAIASVLARP